MTIIKVIVDTMTPGRGRRKPKRHGEMCIHGTDSAIFPVEFKPTKFEVKFLDAEPIYPPTCGPVVPDSCSGLIVKDPNNSRKSAIQVSWSTRGSRNLYWMVEGTR